jgi:hypothetical protein
VQRQRSSELLDSHKFSRPPPPFTKTEQESSVDNKGAKDAGSIEPPVKSSDTGVHESQNSPGSADRTFIPPPVNTSRAMELLSMSEDTRKDTRIHNAGSIGSYSLSYQPSREIPSDTIRTKNEQLPVTV